MTKKKNTQENTQESTRVNLKAGDLIEFHYIKSPQFRSFHVDGIVGSLTPGGMVTIGFYNERTAIPTKVVHRLTNEGALGPEVESEGEGKAGFARELDAVAILSLANAEKLHRWLEVRLQEAKAVQDEVKRAKEKK